MFETTTYFLQNTTRRNNLSGEEYYVSLAARRLYRRVRRRARIGQWVANVTGRQTGRRLIDLVGFTGDRTSGARHSSGIQTVPLSDIRGSVGRCDDYDAAFHPLRANTDQRWLRVATARQDGVGLPLVQLIRVGDTYFLQDGHHRVSVARARGELKIEAEVTVWELTKAAFQNKLTQYRSDALLCSCTTRLLPNAS